MAEKPTIEQIEEQGQITAGPRGQKLVSVRALVRVRDQGRYNEPGEVFSMELSLVPAHVAAGQVELATVAAAESNGTPSRRKAARTRGAT